MDITPKKSLGQHFLRSPKALEDITEAACVRPNESILEIGPGTGILTERLLSAGARVMAVEKDVRACEFLRQRFSREISDGKLELVEGDVLSPSFQPPASAGTYSIVANIPYYITGAILERFLEHGPRPDRMVLLVQKEVAERIIARGTGNTQQGTESILSISVKGFGDPALVSIVPSGAFVPPPTVDSAILRISDISDRRFLEYGLSPKDFFIIVRAGFAHKRKFAARNLEAVASREAIERAWSGIGLDPKIRAEKITLEQWFKLARMIHTA